MIREAIDRVVSAFKPAGKPGPSAGPPTLREDSEARSQLNSQIDAMLQASIEEQRNWERLDADGINYVFGNQLAGVPLKEAFERIQCNKIFPVVMQELSILAQRRPTIVAEPVEESDVAQTELWQAVLQWQYEQGLRVPGLLHRATWDARTFGRAVVKLRWNDEAGWNADDEQWEGMPEADLCRRWAFGCDPVAETVAKAEYAYTYTEMSIEEAKLLWPQHAEHIESALREDEEPLIGGGVSGLSQVAMDLPTQDGAAVRGQTDSGPMGAKEGELAGLIARPTVGRMENVGGEVRKATIQVLEIWFKDRTRKTVTRDELVPLDDLFGTGVVIQQEAADGLGRMNVLAATGEELTATNWPARKIKIENVPSYPNGRRVLRLGTDRIVEDGPWPLARWPFAILRNMILPHTLQGLNAVTMVKGLQDSINDVASHFGTYLKFFADPTLKVEKGALTYDPKAGPGQIIETQAGKFNLVAYESPPPLSAGALEIYNVLADELRKNTGMEELALGGVTQSKTKAEAVMLQTNSRMRTAYQSLLVDEFIIELMELVQMFCQAYWTEGQVVRVAGENRARRVAMAPEVLNARFDLRLDVGTVLPFDKEQRRIEAGELFTMLGPIMAEYVLDAYDVPNKEKYLAMFEGWQALQQLAASREQAGQGGAPGPGAQNPTEAVTA